MMKDILDYLCYEVPIRHNMAVKIRFLAQLKQSFEDRGFECTLWKPKDTKMVHLVVGDPNTAKTVVLVGYDTPIKLGLPNGNYYPLNGEKNAKNERLSVVLRAVFFSLCSFACVVGAALLSQLQTAWRYPLFILLGIGAVLFGMGVRGIPNGNNLNKNTAALAIALHYLQTYTGKKNRLSFIFLDRAADTYQGYNAFKAELGTALHNTNVVILEALADGKTNFMATNFPESPITDSVAKTGAFEIIPVEKTEEHPSIVGLFNRTFYFFCGERSGDEIVISGTRSKKDRYYSLGNMELIYKTLCSCIP